MIKILLIHYFAFICILGQLFAQVSAEFPSRLEKQFQGYAFDQIYLQTSKDIYETGEDLWFKAYQLDSRSMGLSGRSQTLYLQLITPHDSVVWQEKYPIINGISEGHIYLDAKLPIGNYQLEAYSRYSFYEDSTKHLESLPIISCRSIKLVTEIAKHTPMPTPKDSTICFELFPEGGNLLHGVSGRLAFKATNGKGLPVSVEGMLMEDEKNISALKSFHDGMGSILFTPDGDKKYHVMLSNGVRYELPTIYRSGISLHLRKQNNSELEFIISQQQGASPQRIYLMGQMRGVVSCVAQGVLKESLKVKIPTLEFPYQGIAEFTLYNEAMQPMAERLVYLHTGKQLQIKTTLSKQRFATREKVTLKINVSDDSGNPVQTNLGISIYDKAYQDICNPTNMLSHCYLSSQIKGHIHYPTYYFDSDNKKRKEHLDLLLLTQGWRRYIWSANAQPHVGKPFLTDEIRGKQLLGKKKSRKVMQNTTQLVQVSGAAEGSQFVYTDSLGNFAVTPDLLYALRGGYLYLKPMLDDEHKPELEIEDLFPRIDTVRQGRNYFQSLMDLSSIKQEQQFHAPITGGDNSILLDELVIIKKSRRPIRDKFMGKLDSLMQMELNPAWVCKCGGTFHYLNDYKKGYTHHPRNNYSGERAKPIIGKAYDLTKYEFYAPAGHWYLTDQTIIEYQGPIYTDEELLRMNNLWRTKGFYAAREFYEPDEIDMQLSIPDNRNTLLWKPSVVTDKKGEAEVSFFCSDLNTEFIGVIEGTDGTGLIGSELCSFRVIKEYY